MCMDKINEFGETFVYFSQMKRYLRLSKNLQFCGLRYPICIMCIRSGTNIAIKANVRTITNYKTNDTRTLQTVVCIEKNSGNINL